MKRIQILYLYTKDEFNLYSCIIKNTLIECLSINNDIDCFENKSEDEDNNKLLKIKSNCYNLVFVQNSQSLLQFKPLLQILRNTPLIFVSYGNDIHGYIAPIDNLFAVFKFGEADLKSWGIPEEIQTCLKVPVQKTNRYPYKKKGEKIPQIIYYPTKDSIATSDSVLLSVLKRLSKIRLTIVNDIYSVLASSLPADVRVVSRKTSLYTMQKADVVIASGFDAVQAIANAQPCIILGDYGLGGLVKQENYEILQKWNFQGRAGAYFREYVPDELLGYEINIALHNTNKQSLQWLQKRIIEDYNEQSFREKINEQLQSILSVSRKLKSRKTLLQLKPMLTSVFSLEEKGDIIYIKRGNAYYNIIDEELQMVLKQCDGQNTIEEIADCGFCYAISAMRWYC